MKLDYKNFRIEYGRNNWNRKIKLTKTESNILFQLVKEKGNVIEYERFDNNRRALSVMIYRLNKKVNHIIKTRIGIGYYINKSENIYIKED